MADIENSIMAAKQGFEDIYLSGIGNTKHCIEKLLHSLDEKAQAVPIENHNKSLYWLISMEQAKELRITVANGFEVKM